MWPSGSSEARKRISWGWCLYPFVRPRSTACASKASRHSATRPRASRCLGCRVQSRTVSLGPVALLDVPRTIDAAAELRLACVADVAAALDRVAQHLLRVDLHRAAALDRELGALGGQLGQVQAARPLDRSDQAPRDALRV